MKLIRFLQNFFSVDGCGNTSVKYAQGQSYPQCEETLSQVAAGAAEVVEVSAEDAGVVSAVGSAEVANVAPQTQSASVLETPAQTDPASADPSAGA